MNSAYWGGACGEPGVGDATTEYMEDCLSLISTIDQTFWEGQHKYRLEWQPGENGYIEWFVFIAIFN